MKEPGLFWARMGAVLGTFLALIIVIFLWVNFGSVTYKVMTASTTQTTQPAELPFESAKGWTSPLGWQKLVAGPTFDTTTRMFEVVFLLEDGKYSRECLAVFPSLGSAAEDAMTRNSGQEVFILERSYRHGDTGLQSLYFVGRKSRGDEKLAKQPATEIKPWPRH